MFYMFTVRAIPLVRDLDQVLDLLYYSSMTLNLFASSYNRQMFIVSCAHVEFINFGVIMLVLLL